jgi:hypothetical protein
MYVAESTCKEKRKNKGKDRGSLKRNYTATMPFSAEMKPLNGDIPVGNWEKHTDEHELYPIKDLER